jgi:hypothetical protein
MCRRQKERGVNVVQAKSTPVWLRDVGLKDERSDGAGDEVPVFAQGNRYHRLRLDDRVAIAIEWTDIEIGEVL